MALEIIEITLDCPSCGSRISWAYDEENGIFRDLKGCPGAQCTLTFNLGIHEISMGRANEIRENQSP
jgi:hypothetical protein